MTHYICIDIGGTSIKYGIYDDASQQFVRHDSTPTHADQGGPHIVITVLGLIEGLSHAATAPLYGICVSTAGMVDCATGSIAYSSELIPRYTGTPLKSMIEQQTGLPCEVENDVNCAGLAEYHAGNARGAKTALCLTVGTGIGGSYIDHGRVLHGAGGSACEVGYIHLPGGDFQDLASTTALVRRVATRKNMQAEDLSGKRIFELAQQGDTDCAEAINTMTTYLGMGIANICYVLNPEVVILGGGIMAQSDYLGGPIRRALDDNLRKPVARATSLRFAHHRNRAGMLGAYYHFRYMQESRKHGSF